MKLVLAVVVAACLVENAFSRPSSGPYPEPVAEAVSAPEAEPVPEALPTAEAYPHAISSAIAYSFSRAVPDAFAKAFPKPIPEPYATAIAIAQAIPMLEEIIPMLANIPGLMEWLTAVLGIAAL
uniref:Uncharacterized protein n=1 Tax=Cuerna arida TaxID=1464854 RepID=A0A1B6GRX0_9HEMI